jgi:hypothetical protein
MDLLVAVLVGLPVAWHLAAVAGVYRDAGRVGMGRGKWTVVVAVLPLFGLFAYVLERSELRSDDGTDPYEAGTYDLHESVRGDGGRGDR